jgi:Polymerase beta, Nucleotidyltransferase
MPSRAIDDPILKRFRVALDEIYGDRLERGVLFGSRARGGARQDSDYDIAVFIQDLGLLPSELARRRRQGGVTWPPAAECRPDRNSSRCSGLRQWVTLGITEFVRASNRLTVSSASSSCPICA